MHLMKRGIVVAVCTASLAVTSAYGQARMFALPVGVSPGDPGDVPGSNFVIQAVGGDVITFDIWLENMDPAIPPATGLKTHQEWFFCSYTPTGVGAGSVDFSVNSIVDNRCDYVFPIFGLCPPPTVSHLSVTENQGVCPTVVTNNEPRTANVATPNPTFGEVFPLVSTARYLATWEFTVSPDAQGNFILEPRDVDPGTGTQLTKILDDTDTLLTITVDTIEINVPLGQCCIADVCQDPNGTGQTTEAECDALGGTFTAGSSCADSCLCTTDANCQAGGVFDDGNVCTDDACNPADANAEPTTGCVRTNNSVPCDDGDLCTENDVCSGGACAGSPVDCSALDISDGGAICVLGVCNGATGLCEAQDTNAACDDGDPCTGNDVCTGPTCAGTLIDNIGFGCTTDAECQSQFQTGFAFCDIDGQCNCATTCPAGGICIVPVTDVCTQLGDQLCFNIVAGPNQAIAGGQFFLTWPNDIMTFASADPLSPWTQEIWEVLGMEGGNGTLDYAVGLPLGGSPATTGDMALICFDTQGTPADCCDAITVDFRPHNPPTRLVGAQGEDLGATTEAVPALGVQDGPPVLTLPADQNLNSDACTCTAVAVFEDPTGIDGCDGDVGVTCTQQSFDLGGGLIGDLGLASGDQFPRGCTVYDCTTGADSGGLITTGSFQICVSGNNLAIAAVDLQPVTAGDPLTRCLSFKFERCGAVAEVLLQEVTFGDPFYPPGQVKKVELLVPCSQGCYDCVTAMDPLHTLPSLDTSVVVDGTTYQVEFQGDPANGGNWLIGGNLDGFDGDGIARIDILDFGTWLANQGPVAADTTCPPVGPHADINGDGVVNPADFTFISVNFLKTAKDTCCDDGGPLTDPSSGRVKQGDPSRSPNGALTRISVRDLVKMGLGHLRVADLNHDGWVDTADMALVGD